MNTRYILSTDKSARDFAMQMFLSLRDFDEVHVDNVVKYIDSYLCAYKKSFFSIRALRSFRLIELSQDMGKSIDSIIENHSDSMLDSYYEFSSTAEYFADCLCVIQFNDASYFDLFFKFFQECVNYDNDLIFSI